MHLITNNVFLVQDLLTIDSWTGNFCSLSEADTSKRTMFSRAGQGYRVDHFV